MALRPKALVDHDDATANWGDRQREYPVPHVVLWGAVGFTY
jgi:hypothetical protein